MLLVVGQVPSLPIRAAAFILLIAHAPLTRKGC